MIILETLEYIVILYILLFLENIILLYYTIYYTFYYTIKHFNGIIKSYIYEF